MAQNTAGVAFKWGAGTSSGAKPTTWTHIAGITDIPEIGGDVETIEVTTLDNTVSKTYIDGLLDPGGSIGLTAYDTVEFRTAWEAFVTASRAENGAWAAIEIPEPLNKRILFPAKATPLGFGGAAVSSALSTTAYLTPTGEFQWEDITVGS